MKANAQNLATLIQRPDPFVPLILLFGENAMRVAIKRQELAKSLAGENAEADMRLTRLQGADILSNAAPLIDAIKAVGFFPGARLVIVENTTDGCAKTVTAALDTWQDGDAQIILTAKQLNKSSKLRKAVEADPKSLAIGIYNDPPNRQEIETKLRALGLGSLDRDAETMVNALARELDPGDFAQFLEKLSLYVHGAEHPVSVADVEAVAPASVEADLDDAVLAVFSKGRTAVPETMARLSAQGAQPVGICIALQRHIKILHLLKSHPGGTGVAMNGMRPPIFGPRRDTLLQQASRWNFHNLEVALQQLVETDLQLRSAGQIAPQMAVVERAMIRIAMLGER